MLQVVPSKPSKTKPKTTQRAKPKPKPSSNSNSFPSPKALKKLWDTVWDIANGVKYIDLSKADQELFSLAISRLYDKNQLDFDNLYLSFNSFVAAHPCGSELIYAKEFIRAHKNAPDHYMSAHSLIHDVLSKLHTITLSTPGMHSREANLLDGWVKEMRYILRQNMNVPAIIPKMSTVLVIVPQLTSKNPRARTATTTYTTIQPFKSQSKLQSQSHDVFVNLFSFLFIISIVSLGILKRRKRLAITRNRKNALRFAEVSDELSNQMVGTITSLYNQVDDLKTQLSVTEHENRLLAELIDYGRSR